MTVTRTIEFLPSFFQTEQNRKFLSATLDQLVSEPDLVRINGYVGRKNAANFKSGDNYLIESTDPRSNYQLEPSVITRNSNNDVDFVGGYQDLVDKLSFLGVDTVDQSRLFSNEYYSYNGLVNFDKFINFSQYYWLPDGPDSVIVSGTDTPVQFNFALTPDARGRGFTTVGQGNMINPTLTLVRGGRYQFSSSGTGQLWVQSEPGTSGVRQQQPSISSREVLGVSGNGQSTIVFNVPQVNAQDQFLRMPKVQDIDLICSLTYANIQGKTFAQLAATHPEGIDSQRNLSGKLIIFLNPADFDDEIDWTVNGIAPAPELRYGIWRFPDATTPGTVIDLEYQRPVALNEKVFVREGRTGGAREYFKNLSNRYQLIPAITVVQDTLFYQDSSNPDFVGQIRLVEPVVIVPIDVSADIIGKPQYTSPNGVKFTNGLKVRFDGVVIPLIYSGNEYYVEGVGTSIQLVSRDLLITPEGFNTNQSIGFDIGGYDSTNYDAVLNAPTVPVYVTINRGSCDLNPWSRNNRWFHEDVIAITSKYNNFIPVLSQAARANRPILEFDANLALFNSGRIGKTAVDLYDTTIQDAFGRTGDPAAWVEGNTAALLDGVTVSPGMRVIFAADTEESVRNKIYVVNFIDPDGSGTTPQIIHLTLAPDGDVEIYDSIVVTGGPRAGTSYWFNGTSWQTSQQLLAINQEPLFDVIDSRGVSLGDPVVYPVAATGNEFTGTKIISYHRGSGRIDSVLGFPLSYRNFASVGDIVFDNNYSTDTFNYLSTDDVVLSRRTDIGDLGMILDRFTLVRENVWAKITEESKQFQQFGFDFTGDNKFPINTTAAVSNDVPNTKVYINNKLQPATAYSYVSSYIQIDAAILARGDRVDIYVYGATPSSNGFYQVPVNLDNNSVNLNFDSVTLGQMRNHIQTCYENSIGAVGVFPGNSNIRDMPIKNNPGKILQHSAPLTYAMLFMNNQTANFERGIDLSRREYTRFKNKFLEMAFNTVDVDLYDTVAAVDFILRDLNGYKTPDMPWFYSDMIPFGDDRREIVHEIKNITTANYEINQVYMDNVPGNRAVLVYLNGIQLVRGIDYTFDTSSPNLILSATLVRDFDDILLVVDYGNTDGCFVPETPTKLGLYPRFTPEIVTDYAFRTPQTVIVGHDGSRTVAFGDFRDDLLLELEKRIYNNLKVEYDSTRLDINSIRPGKFRDTAFSRTEFNQLLATYFMRWVGSNRIEYNENTFYNNSDGFTWCYSKFVDKLDGEKLPGAWRGIFRYYFDCKDPSQKPWEMLGFYQQPEWWENAYGPAPYTSGNLVLWDDLAEGKILSGPRAGIDPLYVRPGLQSIIPVDAYGAVLSPHEFLVRQYESRNTVGSFVSGDEGPAEAAWANSSEYPFAVQYALALSAPAKFFGLQINTHDYLHDAQLDQYLYAGTNNRLVQNDIQVHGEEYNGIVSRTTGYLNWIADYLRSMGLDAKAELTRALTEFTVQLTYKMAGYTDKRLIKAFAEQASPTSVNESIIVPDEDFDIVLNKSVPVKQLSYSAVLVTKTNNGWSVEGYNLENPVFTIIPGDVTGAKKQVKESNATVTVYQNSRGVAVDIPYGTEFTSRQQVTDFLISYERHLMAQGFRFDTASKELAETQDWILSTREFLAWSQQGWKEGNILVLTPVANKLVVNNDKFIIDSLNDAKSRGSLIDLNFKMLNTQDFRVFRDTDNTAITISQQSVGLASLTAVQYEHILVFNNTTVFNDVIYQPALGNRQARIKLVGKKTGSWDGSLTAPGFILNQASIAEWQPGRDYKKADIVQYKGQFYVASKDLVAVDLFNYNDWIASDYGDVARGLLPNFANRAGAISNYYGVDDVNLEQDQDALSKGLIGFRSRSYLADIGVDDSSQVKFYQGFIKEKGTRKSLESLTRAQIDRLSSDIRFFEDWAIRVGEYGAISSTQAVEVVLDEAKFSANPSFFTFVNAGDAIPQGRQGLALTDLHRRPEKFQADLFLSEKSSQRRLDSEFNTTGPVRIDDVDLTLFDITQYSTLNSAIATMGVGTRLWVAKDDTQNWDVMRLIRTAARVTAVSNLGDGLVLFNTNIPHGLAQGQYVVLKNTGVLFDGVYKITLVTSLDGIVVEYTGEAITGLETQRGLDGYILRFDSLRVESPSDIWGLRDRDTVWQPGDKAWVSRNNAAGDWAVYEKTEPWIEQYQLTDAVASIGTGYGSCFAKAVSGNILVTGSPGNSSVTVYTKTSLAAEFAVAQQLLAPMSEVGFGTSVATGTGEIIVVGAPSSTGKVYVYQRVGQTYTQINELTGANGFGHAVAISNNDLWLFVGTPGANTVNVYKRNMTSGIYEAQANISPADAVAGDMFGFTLQCTSDGSQLVVSAPGMTSAGINGGAIYTYDRIVEAQLGTGVETTFTTRRSFVGGTIPVVSIDNNILAQSEYTVIAPNQILFITPPRINRIVRIGVGEFKLIQRISAQTPSAQAQFGYSLAVCPNDCSIYVGEPAADNMATGVRNAGAVTRFVNQGRIYGTILGKNINPIVNISDSIRIDDFEIVFSGSTVNAVADDINAASLVGISAAVEAGKLRITSNSMLSFIKLRILPGQGNALFDLGLDVYTQTQRIENPAQEEDGRFGESVSVSSQATRIAVGSPDKNTVVRTSLDGGATILDNKSTTINSAITRSGSAHMYQLLPNEYGSITMPSMLGLAQTLYPSTLTTGDRFGAASIFFQNTLYVGSPGSQAIPTVWTSLTAYNVGDLVEFSDLIYLVIRDYISDEQFNVETLEDGNVIVSEQGLITVFEDSMGSGGWTTTSIQPVQVRIDAINNAFAYDKTTGNKVLTLDFIDPAKGRVLGQASQEIDYKTSQDPAYYNNGSGANVVPELAWSQTQVGKVWWDLSLVRWIEYEQGDFAYRAANWGRTFPGSQIKIYEWVESMVPPTIYANGTADGTARLDGQTPFTVVNTYDNIGGTFVTKYYYWVEGTNKMGVNGQPLSLNSMVDLISSPSTSGVPYLTFIDVDTVGVWNASDVLRNTDIILHIDYDTTVNTDLIHSEYQLIQEGNADSIIPVAIINKIVDSLSGVNRVGDAVPDPVLPAAERYGVSIRPRQSVFRDQGRALRLATSLLNARFREQPILTQGHDLSGLSISSTTPSATVGGYVDTVSDTVSLGYIVIADYSASDRVLVEYDTTVKGWAIYTLLNGEWTITDPIRDTQQINTGLFWQVQDWYAPGFSAVSKFTAIVESENDLVQLTLRNGDTVRVRNSGTGAFKIYQVANDGSLITVGLQNATLQILDTVWQQRPAQETRNILNSGFSVFAGRVEFNDIFFALMRFALSEQPYVDWIFKTSFITILQKIRRLEQFATYQRDNQDFVRDFIDEVKPYRTKIREYLLSYETLDLWAGDVTDFDLPGYYDTDYLRFRSPSGELPPDPELWLLPNNRNWFENYTYEIGEIVLTSPGTGYGAFPPRVVITGGGGSGATAVSQVANGEVRRVIVTNAGTGYTSTPDITLVSSSGSGARATARLSNTLTRKINSTIAFDRVSYKETDYSAAVAWMPVTPPNYYQPGQLISYAGRYYYAARQFGNLETFSIANLIPVDDEAPDLSTSVAWAHATTYDEGQLINYGGIYYFATRDFYSGDNFSTEHLILSTDTAADRVDKFYDPLPGMPPKDLRQIFDGIEYPGVFVTGRRFIDSTEVVEDTVIRSSYLDAGLGVRPEDIIVDGGEYLDTYNSHAPQELVPGTTFDALDLRVFTIAPTSPMGLSAGPIVRVYSFRGDGNTVQHVVAESNTHADTIMVYSGVDGQLAEGVDFTFDRHSAMVTFTQAPATADNIVVYLIGDAGYGKILDLILMPDGVRDTFQFPTLTYTLVTDLYVTVDGVKTLEYVFSAATGGSEIKFTTPPAAGAHVHMFAYSSTASKKNFSEVYTQLTTVVSNNYPEDYLIALDTPLLYEGPLGANIIVEVNGLRLRPINNVYYVADGTSVEFTIPETVTVNQLLIGNSQVEVHVAGIRLLNGVGYVLAPVDGEESRAVILTTAPIAGTEVVVSLTVAAEFSVSSTTQVDLTLLGDTALQPGDEIKIISYSNHDALKIRTQVFVGATADLVLADPGFDGVVFDVGGLGFDSIISIDVATKVYTFQTATTILDDAPPNSNYVWATLDGRRLQPNYDFVMLSHGVLIIGDHLTVTSTSVIVITSFAENTQVETVGFRIFKNANDEVSYLRISESNTTTLAAPLMLTDTEVSVISVDDLPVPNTQLASPGIVFINGERLTYYEIDPDNNLLKRISRATQGTSAPAVHSAGMLVVDGSSEQAIPGSMHKINSATLSYRLVQSLRDQARLIVDILGPVLSSQVVVRATSTLTGNTLEMAQSDYTLTVDASGLNPLVITITNAEYTESDNQSVLYEFSVYEQVGNVVQNGLVYTTSTLGSREDGLDVQVRVGGKLLNATKDSPPLRDDYNVSVQGGEVTVTLAAAPDMRLSTVEIFTETSTIFLDGDGRAVSDPVKKATSGVGISYSNTPQARFLKARPSYLPG